MKITIKLSETNNALLNRVVKEEKVDASEFANSAFLDKFLPVSEKLGIEAGFILQEHEAGSVARQAVHLTWNPLAGKTPYP